MRRTALYRHYNAKNELLYVGISLSAVARLQEHRARAIWFDEISLVTISWFKSREAAREEEQAAIENEKPRWNIAGSALPPRVNTHARTEVFVVLHVESGLVSKFKEDIQLASYLAKRYRRRYPKDTFSVVRFCVLNGISLPNRFPGIVNEHRWPNAPRPAPWTVSEGCKRRELALDRIANFQQMNHRLRAVCEAEVLRLAAQADYELRLAA